MSADLKTCYQTLLPAADVGWWTRLQALHGAIARYTALSIDAMHWSADELDANIPEFVVDPAWSPLERYERIRRLAADAAGHVREYCADYQAAREKLLTIAPAAGLLLPSVFHVLEGHLSALEAAEKVGRGLAALAEATEQPTPSDNSTAKRRRGRSVAELDEAVAGYLWQNKHRRDAITSEEIAKHLGCSASAVRKTSSWKVHSQRRQAAARPALAKAVSLTNKLLAVQADNRVLPPDEELELAEALQAEPQPLTEEQRQAEIARLVAEQEADARADRRGYRRR